MADCSLGKVERRLTDALVPWVECKHSYCDPDSFRRSLNNCIQALRNVTFILQKDKGKFPAFDAWYVIWQQKMRKDPVLRWLIEARNQVVKQGDLETFSEARVALVRSYQELPLEEFSVPPMTPTEGIARVLAASRPDSVKVLDGLLRVERRWVEVNLPEVELLEALSHVFNVLTELLIDAHGRFLSPIDRESCKWWNETQSVCGKLPPCMIAQEWDRTVWVDLGSGSLVKAAQRHVTVSEKNLRAVRERYPAAINLVKELKHARDITELVDNYFEQAKILLCRDGYHVSIVFLGYPNGAMQLHQLAIPDGTMKELIFRQLAVNVAKTGATSVIMIGEIWLAPYRKNAKQVSRAHDPERREALEVLGANAAGEVYVRRVIFHKDAQGGIIFDSDFDGGCEELFFLEPLREVWKCKWAWISRPQE